MCPLVRRVPMSRRREGQTRIGPQAFCQPETSPSVCLDANPGCHPPTGWLQRVRTPSLRTLRSLATRYSYVNSEKWEEYYQSVPVSSQIVGQTGLPSALRHKGLFAYEWSCRKALAMR
jgi:hypothetical protein